MPTVTENTYMQNQKKPEIVKVSDIVHIYDNSEIPFRIFKKRKTEYFFWENEYWSENKIKELVKI